MPNIHLRQLFIKVTGTFILLLFLAVKGHLYVAWLWVLPRDGLGLLSILCGFACRIYKGLLCNATLIYAGTYFASGLNFSRKVENDSFPSL